MAFFRQPYPFGVSFWRRFFNGLGFAMVIFLLVYFIPMPEGYGYDRPAMEVASWLAGVVFFMWGLLNLLVPFLFRRYFYTQRWTMGRHLLWIICSLLVIWIALMPFVAMFLGRELVEAAQDRGVLMVMGVSVVVVFVVVFVRFYMGRSRGLKTAEQLNQLLQAAFHRETPARAAVHIHERGKSVLNVLSEKLLYVQSDEKFAYGYCLTEGEVKRYLVRRQLKSIAEDLDSLPQLAMCHPDYLVNVDNISHFTGNAQGVFLHMKGAEAVLPLSSACLSELKEKLAH